MKVALCDKLHAVRSLNLTVDIWTDRKMRAYLGITAHYISCNEKNQSKLCSSLLGCNRFEESHTGELIAAEIERLLDTFIFKRKIDYIITDNAANMRKALTISFEGIDSSDCGSDETMIDEPDLWQDLDIDEGREVDVTINANLQSERLSCFDHSLHLTVGDDFKDTKCVSGALAKILQNIFTATH